MEKRNETFRILKPVCVALSQALLTFSANGKTGEEVTACLGRLKVEIDARGGEQDALDAKLADYVFFPLSQVLKASRDLPVRAMELCLQCLTVLISKGWKDTIDPSLSAQLLIFLSLTLDTSGKTIAVTQMTDELRLSGFRCLKALFRLTSKSNTVKSSLVATSNVPSLGHAISVVLDGIAESEATEVQLSAAESLLALLQCIQDVEVLSSFFPGMVSNLAKVLTPSTKTRRGWKVIAINLRLLKVLLLALLSNKIVATFVKADDASKEAKSTDVLNTKWTEATASQVKIALAHVEKLNAHSRSEVQEALADLNISILSDCDVALQNCSQMAIETLLTLMNPEVFSAQVIQAQLETLARSKPAISDALASIFHNGLLSLPRIMHSNDDQAKIKALQHIFSTYNLLLSSNADRRLLSQRLAIGLKDSVTAILQSAGHTSITSPHDGPSLLLSELSHIDGDQASMSFSNPLAAYKSQGTLLDSIKAQLDVASETKLNSMMASELIPNIRISEGDSQVSTFWLVLHNMKAADSTTHLMDEFLSFDDSTSTQDDMIMEQLYSFALEIVTDTEAEWRLQILALETIAMQAKKQGRDFRNELLDTLYPILHHLGSNTPQVRWHAVTCLNIVSDACVYPDVKELIVSNVDYLTNAVALKLNAFDVSPQGPQVLLMMVRLAGSSLLPYLEDSLESIFAALEDYHGYPALVALLFAVLKTIAEEGVKSPQLQIAQGQGEAESVVADWTPITIDNLVKMVQKSASVERPNSPDDLPEQVPQKPWKELDSQFKQTEEDMKRERDREEEGDEDAGPTDQPSPPPAPKIFALLLKITALTQHYLSSSSPSLRISLLALIRTTIPALAKHENSYLPLVNTLWPEITSRLLDDEPHVATACMQIISTMCEYAGTFMKSRIVALWPELAKLFRRASREVRMQQVSKGHHSTHAALSLRYTDAGYVDVSSRAVWGSSLELLKTIIKHVGVDADTFEEILSMLQPLQELNEDIMAIFNEYNADAVWLAQYRSGSCNAAKGPAASSDQWHFAESVC
ncbi:hypothetical protein AAFC00_004083 [Neodothiora populina]|uniref:Uncharacterized protein n=1 Tax=Neodothiora populina TaxID=2781224 RepID=A0ABR3PIH1_9PEZI